MDKWIRYVFKHGDLDKDGELNLGELQVLTELNKEREAKGKQGEEDVWDSVEESDGDEDDAYYEDTDTATEF
jgi:hypothetical protein